MRAGKLDTPGMGMAYVTPIYESAGVLGVDFAAAPEPDVARTTGSQPGTWTRRRCSTSPRR